MGPCELGEGYCSAMTLKAPDARICSPVSPEVLAARHSATPLKRWLLQISLWAISKLLRRR